MNSNELKDRTKSFAHRCVKLAMLLPENSLGKVIQYQLVKSSTSIAANYRATCVAQSKSSFIAKMSIVIEELMKQLFGWNLVEEKVFTLDKVGLLLKEAQELTAIFVASRKTANSKRPIDNKK